MYNIVDVVRGRKTTPNSTELRPNSTTLPSQIIRPKFGETELRPISNGQIVTERWLVWNQNDFIILYGMLVAFWSSFV